MSNLSEKTCLAAILAALNPVDDNDDPAPGSALGYTLGELKRMDVLPPAYNEVHLSRKFGDSPRRAGSASDITHWRLLTRAVAMHYGDAQEMRRRAAAALDERIVVIDGEAVVINRAESDDPIGDDDGWWSGLSEWSFAI